MWCSIPILECFWMLTASRRACWRGMGHAPRLKTAALCCLARALDRGAERGDHGLQLLVLRWRGLAVSAGFQLRHRSSGVTGATRDLCGLVSLKNSGWPQAGQFFWGPPLRFFSRRQQRSVVQERSTHLVSLCLAAPSAQRSRPHQPRRTRRRQQHCRPDAWRKNAQGAAARVAQVHGQEAQQ